MNLDQTEVLDPELKGPIKMMLSQMPPTSSMIYLLPVPLPNK